MNRIHREGTLALTLLIALVPGVHGQSEPVPPPSPAVPDAPPTPTVPDAPATISPPLVPPPSSTPSFGSFDGPAALMGNPVGQAPLLASYRITWEPSQHVVGQTADLGFIRNDLTVRVPFWQSPCDEVTGSVLVRGEYFNTGAILPNPPRPFPDELWDVRLGLNYRHQFDNGWIAGAMVSVGSASDRPFASINEMTASFNGFLRVPSGEHNAWLFTLTYSPTSDLAIPIPGVAYIWQPSDCLRVNVGLPFQVMYRPTEDLTLDLSYMLLYNVHARATYRLAPPWKVYAGFDWGNESYFLADRLDNRDRLFYYEKRLTLGTQYRLCGNATLDLSGGYTFDRFYFQGHSYSDRNNDRIDVGDGAFLSLQLQTRW